MLFSNFEFIFIFLPVVFLLCESSWFKGAGKNVILLTISSFVFIRYWNEKSFLVFLWVMLFSALCIWTGAVKTRLRLAVAITLILVPLAYYKYSAFVGSIVGIPFEKHELPLAISFYTFVIVAYFIDMYHKGELVGFKVKCREIRDFFFFTSFFPHLIAGPIVHRDDLVPQIYEEKNSPLLFAEGVAFFLVGFGKKVFLADPLGSIANRIFDSGAAATVSFSDALLGSLSYSLQIYYDFSGYSDMAIGLGLLFGYRLPFNFNSPYQSVSITDFWRRWHITLSRFLRNYVYIPLGGSRRGRLRNYVNILIVMLVSGIWHGAGWTFVLWGTLHGALICLEKFISDNITVCKKWFRPLLPLYTFTMVALLWVLFRATSLEHAANIYFGLMSPTPDFDWSIKESLYIIIGMSLLVFPNSQMVVEKLIKTRFLSRDMLWNTARQSHAGLLLGVALCAVPLSLFYQRAIDHRLYTALSVERDVLGTSNSVADFRSNLFSSPVFTKERKCVFVGSSFTRGISHIHYSYSGGDVYSSSIGMGGNSLYVGLRQAFSILETPGVETIVLGLSALNIGPLEAGPPFKGQLGEKLNKYSSLSLWEKDYSAASKIDLGLWDYARLILFAEDRYQFTEFLFKVSTALGVNSYDSPYWQKYIEYELVQGVSPNEAFSRFLHWQRLNLTGELPENVENGRNVRFRWLHRGTYQALSTNGDVAIALSALKEQCDIRGIRLVIYSTPTPLHSSAPDIYPEGYHEEYQSRMGELMAELQIEYYDLSSALDWDKGVMSDFIHPMPSARKELHKLLISYVYGQ
ncbi:MBOAT family O-acyltransferase [Oleidesulfovibrio sp.]|uniref:MBOAT family O-acyltransferase n=1 Tax=Oleidesulfovibrio sp. TaxID=2909707 RepID=UPI003A86783D